MKRTFAIIFLIALFTNSFGQINTDSIFNLATTHAQNKNYNKAIEQAKTVLEIHPERYDVIVFIANVYAWKSEYKTALEFIDKAYLITQTNKELYDAWLNILLWSENYSKLLEITDLAQKNGYDNLYNIVLKKSLAYKALNQYDNGILYIETHENFLDSAKIKLLYDEMLMLNKKMAVSTYYSVDLFENNSPTPQHFAFFDFAYKFKNQTIIARLNYANRFNTYDFQAEADYYFAFKNGHYIYSNYGYGIKNVLFPQHRAGLEYFFPFYNTFEASFGGRYLYSSGRNLYIITGNLSKYIKNLWISFRPFYVLQEQKNTVTTLLNIRYFGENPLNYWGAELLYGNSPDERSTLSQSPEFFTLKKYRIKIEKNTPILKFNELKLSAAYSYEEYFSQSFRNRFTIELLFKHKF